MRFGRAVGFINKNLRVGYRACFYLSVALSVLSELLLKQFVQKLYFHIMAIRHALPMTGISLFEGMALV